MKLAAGDKLGPYEIISLIGAGGMGEVYRARDMRLGRTVALKVSKTQFSDRFEREARAAAALNHPHICQLHDIGPNYLVLEFVEGVPLRGPIPVDRAVQYASQILDALEAAHREGITHRDLKPSNILLTSKGIKLLDFGLALFHPAPAHPLDVPTQTQLTQAGAIVGTPGYIAPELWEGKVADARSDIYSFGLVLYEMVSGKRPGSALVPVEPLALNRVIQTCLAPDPDKRYQRAADVKLNLSWALEPKAKRRRLPWIAAAVALLMIAASVLSWRGLRPGDTALKPLVRMDVDLGTGVTLGSLTGADEILSPDGNRLVYVSQGKLWSRTLDQAKATEMLNTDGAFAPFFSPDGRWIAFFAQGKLKKVPVDGGVGVDLCAAPSPRGGSWGQDGYIIATLSVPGALSRISESGGDPVALTELDQSRGEVTHRWPQILPGGKSVLFTAHTTTGAYDGADLMAVSTADHRTKRLIEGGTYGRYMAAADGSGYLLYVNRAKLFAVHFDPERLETRGTPTPMLEQVAYNAGSGSAQIGFSSTGTLIYRIGGPAGRLVSVQWLDSGGKLEPLLSKPGFYERPSLSPDGARLAMEVTDGSTSDVWIYDWRRDIMTRLTNGARGDPGPVWNPDGHYVVFDGPSGILWARSDGSGQPQTLTTSKNVQQPWSFSPDGRRLAYMEASSSGAYHIWTVPIEPSDAGMRAAGIPAQFLQSSFDERHPRFSPDGNLLAYSSNESGKFQVYVRNFPDRGRRWQVSNDGGVYPEWSHSAPEIFFRTEDNRVMVARYSLKDGSFLTEKARFWSPTRLADLGLNLNFALAPEATRIAALMPVDLPEEQAALHHVIFLINFADELRRRVP